MAKSQLKNLKATLKAHGLTGQTNVTKKKNGGKRRSAKDYDREEKANTLAKIREQFNPFEVKTAKDKLKGISANVRTTAVGKPGISKQIGEDRRRMAYEARKQVQGRTGALVDRRFGERDNQLTEEEKMLERFTRERQRQSKKRSNLYNLDADDDDDDMGAFGTTLTHLGNDVADNFDENNSDPDDSGFRPAKRPYGYDDDTLGGATTGEQPARKKTKAEVMKEVIAKSKFYKHERQKAQGELETQIDTLDDNYDDIMSELMASELKSDKKPDDSVIQKDVNEIDYDKKVKELLLEKRAVPSDRTKTEKELKEEAESRMKKLEQQRLDRMSGMLDQSDEEEQKGVEDLDAGFWDNSDEEDVDEAIANSDDDVEFDDKDATESTMKGPVTCPLTHADLLAMLKDAPLVDHPKHIRAIVKSTQPKLAEGNKERLGTFTGVLLKHILFLSDQNYTSNVQAYEATQNTLVSILKTLSEKYNRALSDECRRTINEIQKRFKVSKFNGIQNSDLAFFILVGMLFSTSDLYHLVVTPCLILMSEILEQTRFNTIERLAYGCVITNILLKYERLSKRYVPEMAYFLQKALYTLLGSSTSSPCIRVDSNSISIDKDTKFDKSQGITIKLHLISTLNKSNSNEFSATVLLNLFEVLSRSITTMWKSEPAFKELSTSFKKILQTYVSKFDTLVQAKELLNTLEKLDKFAEHIPLALQDHKPMVIPSHAPKFEENFNPDKKSYDPDRSRSEISKMKAQLKKERKFMMKELRKDTKFEARQHVEEKKKANQEYHAKMSNIYNTIATEEGAEKNKYEREKKLRSGKK
ncbi:snoRNA-binding rRNA-processing protein NOP14 KNAG_0C03910 [Huiozyma naganishii CBS 8797]|uniref:Nucleolar complex protein 14 n=1 Tax=Huiozyma naganishii (strain ATCC MYA-139 / BCRC 22969 / CBS 8797 / KCTC 17520 / NBRC 10181 / NCYC 3082 / Yp74L-3) TaxID=1071383 RepID=J7R3U8_HUIN7|nr:hypothetical protein KNAG_0C03910 [Kazachstania naganishii CBS 8797]CCK69495.1 hypothetical protein KNAG_0C03910 [Kazachstania naganishii CBS 8797]